MCARCYLPGVAFTSCDPLSSDAGAQFSQEVANGGLNLKRLLGGTFF